MDFAAQARCRRLWLAILVVAALQSLSLVCGGLFAMAQESHATTEPTRPPYQIGSAGRFNEDWSTLRGVDLSATDDVWDRVKFIPLTSEQNVWLSLGGQVRERVEYFHNFLFGGSQPKSSDLYLASRYRLLADLHVTRYFRVFAEGRSAFALDRELQGGRTASFVDEADLVNGFADVMIPFGGLASVTLRGGRQELIFGSQRLVGAGDFTNTAPHAWEGGAAYAKIADWTIIPFWGQLVVVDKYRFNKSTSDSQLFGMFGTGPLYVVPANLDVYWLDSGNKSAAFNGTSGHEHRHTLGGRIWGKIRDSGLDFEVEAAGQFGTIGRGGVTAGMATAVVGYTLPGTPLSPRLYIEFDYASGDKKPGGNVGTFSQLVPDAHAFLGYTDYIGRQNIISGSGGVAVTPIKSLTLSLQQYFYWRASDRDALYDKTGAVLRPGTTTTTRYVGAEIDLYATYDFTRQLRGYAGYSHFFTGDFISKTGKDKDTDFYYVGLQYTF